LSAPGRAGAVGAGRRGFTLIEVAVAVFILAVAMLGLVAAMAGAVQGGDITDDTEVARRAISSKIDEMRASDFTSFFTTYGGATFDVPGLRPPSTGQPAGQVTLLSESQARAYFSAAGGLGLIDLDWNGNFDETKAPAAGWKSYAVRLTVTWGEKGTGGDRSLSVTTIVYDPGT
jgi:prepilin-type N-terminal cleavage/methylation domain-containing protein